MAETSENDELDDLVWLLSKDSQPFGYSIELTRLVDGVSEYTYLDDEGLLVFPSHDEAYQHVRDKKIRLRRSGLADALAAAEARGRVKGLEEAAKIIDENMICDGPDGQVLRPRKDSGNRFGFAYAAKIRAAKEGENG